MNDKIGLTAQQRRGSTTYDVRMFLMPLLFMFIVFASAANRLPMRQEKRAMLPSADLSSLMSNVRRSLVLDTVCSNHHFGSFQFCAATRMASRRDLCQYVRYFCHEVRQQRARVFYADRVRTVFVFFGLATAGRLIAVYADFVREVSV